MKRAPSTLLPLLLLVLSMVSCRSGRDTFDDALLEAEDVCLKVNKADIFVYDPLTCQLASNSAATSFRAFKDDASDYFTLTLGTVPSTSGQKISGCTISWTTEDDIVTKDNLVFQVRKIDEGGFVWLWCPSAKIFALVRIL